MLDLRPIFQMIGLLLVPLGFGMLFPALVDSSLDHPDWQVFVVSSFFTLFIGISLFLSNRGAAEQQLSIKQAFVLTVLIWVVLPAFAALPLMFSELNLTYTDAYFEAMSGLTTTGSTVITGLDTAPPGILIWRAVLQWLGGVGIIVMAIAVLPMLKVGGMQLFRMESSDTSEKILPRVTQISGAIIGLYITLTIVCFMALVFAGMTPFDGAAHAMTTIATGGFSTSDMSLAKYDTALVHYIEVLFMLVGSLPFVLYLQVVRGRPMKLWQDSQVRVFIGLVIILVLIMAVWLSYTQSFSLADAMRYSSFNTVSILTGTGYSTAAFDTWGTFALVFFFLIMFIGGCAGSTTCGIKIFRFQVLFSSVMSQIKKLSQPHAVFRPQFNKRPISENVIDAVLGFMVLFFVSFVALALALALTGVDYMTAISGAAAAIANVGPGLGEIIGPSGTFAPLSDAGKWILAFGMLLGRLELFPVLVLFSLHFWRS